MKKIPVQFKESQICYCANLMFNIVANQFFYLVRDVSNALKDNEYQPDDLITVEVEPETLTSLYSILGQRPEKLTAKMHGEMKVSLYNQLVYLSQSEDAEMKVSVNYIFNHMQKNDSEIDAWIASEITQGRKLLLL